MFDRVVTLTPRIQDGTDARGNATIVDGTPLQVRAARDLVDTAEEVEGRDQQTERYRFFLAPFAEDGTPVTADGRARITDGDETFEVDGLVDPATRRRRGVVHHLEANAYREV